MKIGEQELDFKSWQDIKAQCSSKMLAPCHPYGQFQVSILLPWKHCSSCPQEEVRPVLTLTLWVPWLLNERPGLR